MAGNRISKAVTMGENTTTTWYSRDAQGNTLTVYEEKSETLNLAEHHLYGSSRLGLWSRNIGMNGGVPDPDLERGNKFFELSNHLGNVLVTVSDRKTGVDSDSDGDIDFYLADVVTATDYAPFGMSLVNRSFRADGSYRYGFNGKENDNEVKGEGNQQDYGMRIYDPRLGRFLSMDPLSRFYPWYTPYQFAGNDVIRNIDLDGGEPKPKITPMAEGQQEETSKEVTNARGDYVETRTQIWNWHGGGILKRQEYNQEGQKVNTYSRAGWYTNEEYDKLLKTGTELNHSNSLAAQAAGYSGMFANETAGHNWTEEEKSNLANTSLGAYLAKASDDGINQLAASAQSFANARNLSVSGLAQQSSFNVEDMIGVGLILKAAVKGVVSSAAKGGLPNSGPIMKSLGAASRAEMLAKKLKMNINSPTTRQVLNSLDESVESFISTYRKSSIRSEIPGQFLNQTVEEALKSGNTTIRKLLTDGRFVK